MKICTIIGARPQFIKAAAISREIALYDNITEVLIHTGQHYDQAMSDIFFEQLGIPEPDYNLGIGSGLHGEQTGKMIKEIEQVLISEKPDCTLIYGDTNSTLAAAIASSKLGIPVAHIEAGLRSFNRKMPEEINRIVADSISDILFTPTEGASTQLIKEGHADSSILNVGDVMYDVMLKTVENISDSQKLLSEYGLSAKEYLLVTIHRAENTDEYNNLKNIIDALSLVSKNKKIIFPLHPRTLDALKRENLLNEINDNVLLIEPLGYLEFTTLLNNAWAVATDSGGLQKEAFFHKVPCFTLRPETEWKELVTNGWNILINPKDKDIALKLTDLTGFKKKTIMPYGDGKSAKKIISHLLNTIGK